MEQSELLVLYNFIAYLTTFLVVYKIKGNSLGIYLLLLYTICSLSSVLYVTNPSYKGFTLEADMYWQPFVYLYLCLMILLWPSFNIRADNIDISLSEMQIQRIDYIVNIVIFMQLVCFILLLPDILRVLKSSDLAASRDLVYGGADKSPITLLYNYKLTKYFDLIVIGLKPYILLLGFYVAFINKSLGGKGCFFFWLSLTYSVMRSLVIVSRGEIVFLLLYLFFIILLFKKSINPQIYQKLVLFSAVAVGIFVPFFWAVSVSRFDDLASFFLFRYAGESMCNFNGNLFYQLKGTIDLNIYFPLFAIGQNFAFSTTLEKWDLIMKQSGVSGQYFYTIIGGFLFCFGKVGTVLLCCLINRCYSLVTSFRFDSLSKILPLCLLSDMMIKGIFLFPLQGLTGNIEIVSLFVLMILLRK